MTETGSLGHDTRNNIFAVLISILGLGTGAFLGTFDADIIRGAGAFLIAVSAFGLVPWFLWPKRSGRMAGYFLIAALVFAGLSAVSLVSWRMISATPHIPAVDKQPLKQFYAEGVALRNRTLDPTNTDDSITQLALRTNEWSKKTYDWIDKNLNHVAAMRFNQLTGQIAPPCPLPADCKPETHRLCNDIRSGVTEWLKNLDALISSKKWD